MELSHLILYVVASLLALRSLVSLMAHHKREHLQQMLVETQQEIQRQAKAKAEATGKADAEETSEVAA